MAESDGLTPFGRVRPVRRRAARRLLPHPDYHNTMMMNTVTGAQRTAKAAISTVVVAAPAMPVLVYLLYGSLELLLYTLAGMLFVVIRNRKRLRHPSSVTERLLGEFKEVQEAQ